MGLYFGKSYKRIVSNKSGMIPHRIYYIHPHKCFLVFQKGSFLRASGSGLLQWLLPLHLHLVVYCPHFSFRLEVERLERRNVILHSVNHFHTFEFVCGSRRDNLRINVVLLLSHLVSIIYNRFGSLHLTLFHSLFHQGSSSTH